MKFPNCRSRRKETFRKSSSEISSPGLWKVTVSLRRQLQVGVMAALAVTKVAGATFDEANKLYEQGKFTNAATAYQQLLQSGKASPAVYFNLGNAYFKSGQMGRAVTAYRQAELMTPRDPDIRANLQFARNQIQGPTISMPNWHRWLNKLSLNEWTWSAAVCLWLWFALLILTQMRPSLKTALRKSNLTLGIATSLLMVCLFTTLQIEQLTKTAVVVTPEAVVRQGPLDESVTAFTVHDGAELQVLDRKDEWLQVTIDPRRIGWVRRDQVVLTPQG